MKIGFKLVEIEDIQVPQISQNPHQDFQKPGKGRFFSTPGFFSDCVLELSRLAADAASAE